MLRGQYRSEPIWFGRGSSVCLGIWPNKSGQFHHLYLGNEKWQEISDHMLLADDELIDLAIFLLGVANDRVIDE